MGNTSATNNSSGFNKENFTNQLGSGIQSYFSKGPDPVFGESLYAGLTPTTTGAISKITNDPNNAAFGGGISSAIADYADTAAGNKFGMEAPGYADLRARAIESATTAANSPFLSSGTFGSDKHREAVGRGVTGAIAGLDYQNYQNDIARQTQAAQLLPGLYQAGQLPGQAQLAMGQMLDADAQAKLMGRYDLFERQKNAEFDKLSKTGGLLGMGPIQNQQQRQDPTFLDYLGYGATIAGAFL